MTYVLSHDLDVSQLASAYDLAKISYNWQKWAIIRNTGERYFDHVKAVAYIWAVELWDTNPERTIARLLHDNHEDTRINADILRALYGNKVSSLVSLVSNPPKTGDVKIDAERKKIAYGAMLEFEEASKIKVPDRIHNNRSQELVLMHQWYIPVDTLTQGMIDQGYRKLQETETYIVPMGENLWWKYRELLNTSQKDFSLALEALKDSIRKKK